LRHTLGGLINACLKCVSLSHERLVRSRQSLALLARSGFLSRVLFQSVFKRCAPILRISPQGLGKRQQCCQICAQQRQITVAARSGLSNTFV